MSLEELQEKHAKLTGNSKSIIRNMNKIVNESNRVADVAYCSRELLDELDREFENKTGLRGADIKFLFTAIGLQMARIVVLNELTKIQKAGSGNRNETKLHEFQEKLLKLFGNGEMKQERPYYASMEHIVTKMGVPYDATANLTKDAIQRVFAKGNSWNYDLDEMMPDDNQSLFKGANHRFSTLGHDPVLGLLFGTGNIMTNTITCVKKPLLAAGVGLPMLTTNHVVYTSDYKHPLIAAYASTIQMLGSMAQRTKEEPGAFVASLIKQIIHIGTDLYTPAGIQIPAANLILSNTSVEKLTKYISTGDLIKIGVSAKLSELINLLIGTLHMLMYDEFTMGMSRDLYNVKTRKIIDLSMEITTGSSVLWTAGNVMSGNVSSIRQLDIGGLIVLLKRLREDTTYIRMIKEEYVIGNFKKMIQGNEIELEDIVWD